MLLLILPTGRHYPRPSYSYKLRYQVVAVDLVVADIGADLLQKVG